MTTVSQGNAGLIGAIMQPSVSYGQMAAARQERFQLQGILTQQAEVALAEEQQAVAQQQQYMQQLGSLPFVGRDIQKLGQHLKAEQKAVYDRLATTYNGNFKQFWQVEGPTWMQGASTRLQQSKVYQQGVLNRQNVDMARKAVAEGKVLNGQGSLENYQFGETLLNQFESGMSDGFRFSGAYKPEDDMKEIRGKYAPGHYSWEQVQASDGEVQAQLLQAHDKPTAMDKYLRQYKGVPVFYKSDPMNVKQDYVWKAEDQQMDKGRYGMEQTRLGMEKGRYGMAVQANGRAAQAHNMNMKLGQQKLNKGEEEAQLGAGGFAQKLIGEGGQIQVQIGSAGTKPGVRKLPNGQIDLTKMGGVLNGVPLLGNGYDFLMQQLGLAKGKDGYTGNITEAFTEANGGHVIDLSKSSYTILPLDNTLYYDGKANHSGNAGKLKGFARVRIQFDSGDDAKAAGLWNGDWNVPVAGVGVYRKTEGGWRGDNGGYADLFIGGKDLPAKGLMMNRILKDHLGTSASSKEYYSGGGFPSTAQEDED